MSKHSLYAWKRRFTTAAVAETGKGAGLLNSPENRHVASAKIHRQRTRL